MQSQALDLHLAARPLIRVLAHIPALSPSLSDELRISFFPCLGTLFHFFYMQYCLRYNDTTLVP